MADIFFDNPSPGFVGSQLPHQQLAAAANQSDMTSSGAGGSFARGPCVVSVAHLGLQQLPHETSSPLPHQTRGHVSGGASADHRLSSNFPTHQMSHATTFPHTLTFNNSLSTFESATLPHQVARHHHHHPPSSSSPDNPSSPTPLVIADCVQDTRDKLQKVRENDAVPDSAAQACETKVKAEPPVDESTEEENTPADASGTTAEEEDGADLPLLNIKLNNVVCAFAVRCHLDLKAIAHHAWNVEYRRDMNVVLMKLRKPRCTASIWSSGKITITGCTSEADAKVAARRIARILEKMGNRVRFHNYRVVNILASCALPFTVRLPAFAREHRLLCSYEPELHPGATCRMGDLGATLKVFSTGKLTITAATVASISASVERLFPLVLPHKVLEVAEVLEQGDDVDADEEADVLGVSSAAAASSSRRRQTRHYVRPQDDDEDDSFDSGDDSD